MTDRTVNLETVRGIDRLRTKGGARADWLYDLLNAHVTEQLTVVPRPGTERDAQLPAGTVGLVFFDEGFHIFASSSIDLSGVAGDYLLHILLHPSDSSAEVAEIHFAEPFLGALYVIAEFDNGDVYHFWLQAAEEWEAETEYAANEFTVPTTPNGFTYRATRFGSPYPSWAPGVARTAGNGSSIEPSRIEPTAYNEYYYEAIATVGDSPRSGSVEPAWPESTGATVIENTDGFETTTTEAVQPPAPPPPNQPQPTTTSKYRR